VFTEVTFWNSLNTECFAEVTLLMRNFPLFNSAESHSNSAEFRAISCTEFRIRKLGDKCIQETLDFFVLKSEVEFKNISFAFIYSNDPFGNTLCLKMW
jgi:hypothetical protein